MNIKYFIAVFVFLFGITNLGFGQSVNQEVTKAIQQNFEQMGSAMANGNAKKLAQHFTEDALLKFPGQPPITGRKGIEEAHEKMIEEGIGVKPSTTEVQTFGDMAYEIGTYKLISVESETVIDHGDYSTIWKKKNDEWKIHRDIISSIKPQKSSTKQ
ncbi:YybH family protein [Fodinibius halophilus]|uniref:Nuclear transport factor 2 family protein n=1 Tax=Fodinibius halophilus TaxID=1736908 RepID=A0A6M1T339_9BACT|nr:nuclear transport factor 2 family protein [Fodinibius halophilus]NGP88477.1 nuclear transport factor 2 family protein [Fodinibius halophilus]